MNKKIAIQLPKLHFKRLLYTYHFFHVTAVLCKELVQWLVSKRSYQ